MTPLLSALLTSTWLAFASAYLWKRRMDQSARELKLALVPVRRLPG
jgi:hypothetical protein